MIKKIKDSLTVKMFFITCLLLVFACALTYGFIAWVMPITYTANLNTELKGKAQQLTSQLSKTTLSGCDQILTQFASTNYASIEIIDSRNNIVKTASTQPYITSDNMTVTMTAAEYVLSNDGQYDTVTVSNETPGSKVENYQFNFSDGEGPYSLVITGNVKMVNQAVAALERVLPQLIAAILIISILGSLFYARFVTQPIVKISGISKRMSELEFNWHCDEARSDEIGILGRSLNELSLKLSSALEELRSANTSLKNDIDREREIENKRLEFFSAVSHELKTPITVIKGQLEGMLGDVGVYKDHRKYLARSLSVTVQMKAMVDEILTVSRMESPGFVLHKAKTNFTELVDEKIEYYADLFDQKGLTLHTDLDPDLFVFADGALLQKVIDNLLSNAVFYSPAGQEIRINSHAQGDHICFSIENSGTHIPEESLPRIFEAFYRVEQSRNRHTGGSGLGLYIVKMILEHHGADYKIQNSVDGVLFTFSL